MMLLATKYEITFYDAANTDVDPKEMVLASEHPSTSRHSPESTNTENVCIIPH
jgi:hypothetical protein